MEEKSSGSFNNPYKFSGQELDKNTSLYLFGARYYNPKTSLWLSLDPLAELFPSVGGYVYSYNNPVMFSDPSGLEPDPNGDADCPTCKEDLDEIVIVTKKNKSQEFILPMLPKDAYDGSKKDYLTAVGRGISNTIDIVPKVWNSGVVSVKALSRGTYLSDLKKELYATGKGIKDFITNEWNYALNTSIDQQFKDAYNNYVSPKGVEMMSEMATSGLAGRAITPLKAVQKAPVSAIKTMKQMCFIGGTLISTENEFEKIEDIKVGDLVWSFNEFTKEKELKKVVQLFENQVDKIIKISTRNEIIETTEEHPFYINGIWIEAKNLKIGDYLTSKTGNLIKITNLEIVNKTEKVYNFEVENNHNYYVSQNEILVHNDCFKDFNQARNAALEWLNNNGDFKAEVPVIGKFGTSKGKVIGMMSKDGKRGFRVEFDERSGAHINVWSGKTKGPHITFDATEKQINNLIENYKK